MSKPQFIPHMLPETIGHKQKVCAANIILSLNLFYLSYLNYVLRYPNNVH